jgi:hypothetical protein
MERQNIHKRHMASNYYISQPIIMITGYIKKIHDDVRDMGSPAIKVCFVPSN